MTATVTPIHVSLAADLAGDCITAPVLVERAGISYRQLDYWTRTGLLEPIKVSGVQSGQTYLRQYPPTEVAVACLMGRFASAGMLPRPAHDRARELVETGTTRIAGLPVHLPTDL